MTTPTRMLWLVQALEVFNMIGTQAVVQLDKTGQDDNMLN